MHGCCRAARFWHAWLLPLVRRSLACILTLAIVCNIVGTACYAMQQCNIHAWLLRDSAGETMQRLGNAVQCACMAVAMPRVESPS